ncbi:MAG: septum formation protein Maf [Oscillospiraceae bacterium]|nr:septum formation protein Maf [Oscillospiraceae bacterium]
MIILASQSPRRKELMGLFRVPFTVRVAEVSEDMDRSADPAGQVALVSRRKAEAICRTPEDVVIAADTIVVCQGEILGKPKEEADAFRMLRLLSGKSHQVMTGLTVLYGEKAFVGTEITDVYFRSLTDGQIRDYIRTGEPMDKAGAYGIQGGAALFVEKLVGDYYNVVGLPVCRLSQILEEIQ